MILKIITYDQQLYEDEVARVLLPSVSGEIIVSPKRAPLALLMQVGFIKIRTYQSGVSGRELLGDEKIFKIDGGIAEMKSGVLTLLVDKLEAQN